VDDAHRRARLEGLFFRRQSGGDELLLDVVTRLLDLVGPGRPRADVDQLTQVLEGAGAVELRGR
jgi:hypothetical protein